MADSNDFGMGFALGMDSGNNRNNNNGGFGDNGGIWLIFILAILFGMWGNNGNRGGSGGGTSGNGGGDSMAAFLPYIAGSVTGGGALTRGELCQDMNFADVQAGVRNIGDAVNTGFANLNSTICHQQYDTAMMLNGVTAAVNGGFSGLNSTICQQQYDTAQQINGVNNNIMQGFNAANIVALQGQNALQSQIADCCCKEQTSFMQLGNQVERSFCQTNFNDQANTTAIIQNAHNDTDRILARLDAMESARKDELIAELRSKLANCGDQTTAQYIINQITSILNPRAVPAYPAASPCGLGNWSPAVLANGWGGYNGGCGGCCNGF